MTVFYFVRHGEPDYDTVEDWKQFPFGKEFAGLTEKGRVQIRSVAQNLADLKPELILSSPYTRALQSASIMSKMLCVDIVVEQDLHEWETDLSHSVREEEELIGLCKEYDRCKGIYQKGEKQPLWESRERMKQRVEAVMTKYLNYSSLVVAGHALMMQAVTGEERAYQYGEIVKVYR